MLNPLKIKDTSLIAGPYISLDLENRDQSPVLDQDAFLVVKFNIIYK